MWHLFDMTEMPAYPSPSANTPDGAGLGRPGTINGAFWAFIVSMLVSIVGGILLFFSRDSLTEALQKVNGQNGVRLTESQIDQAVNIGIIAGAIFAIVFALLYLLFAFKLRAGRNWARIVLIVLTVLQVISLLVGQGSLVSYVSVAFAVLGVVLSFLPASNQYIDAVKHHRNAARAPR